MREEEMENLEETPEEMLDEQQANGQLLEDQEEINSNVDDSELDYGDDESSEDWGRKEFEKTLEDKDYYKKEAEELEKERQQAEEEAERDWKYEDEDENSENKEDSDENENSDENQEESEDNASDNKSDDLEKKDQEEDGSTPDQDENENNQTDSENNDDAGDTSENEENQEKNNEDNKSDSEDNSASENENPSNDQENKYIKEDQEKKKNSESEDEKEEKEDTEEKSDSEKEDSEKKKREKTDKEKKEDQKKVKAAKTAQMQNKIDNVKSKAYQVLHPVEAAKAKKKAAIKKFILSHPWIILVAIGIVLGAIFLVIIICLFISLAGALGGKGAANTYSYSSCVTSSSGSLVDFLYGFEGTTNSCTTSDNKPGYVATILSNETVVTAGAGFTNYAMNNSVTRTAISQHNWKKYFHERSSNYYMEQGDCIPQEVLDTLVILNIENNYGQSVLNDAATLELNLSQHEIDAMTSLAYNHGSAYATLEAYKSGGLEAMWDYMKDIVHTQDGAVASGLLSRRKAEFALFVTGDYSDQGLFYSRNYEYGSDDYNNYDSEDVIKRSSICSSFLANSEGLSNIDGYLARLQRPTRTNSYYYMQDGGNYGNLGLEGECAWYAAYRAQEILSTMGSSKTWTSQRNGGDYCNSDEVLDGTFKTSTDYKEAKPGSLISWANGSYGHVAVVEQVTESGITISEAGIGFGYLVKDLGYTSEYLWNTYFPSRNEQEARKYNCEENGSGCFNSRTIAFSDIQQNGGSTFKCYIYLLED